jgi:hypothetical protein
MRGRSPEDSNVLCDALVTGQCLFVCEGSMSELNHAWNWPASVRWDNDTQALVDDYGMLPQLYRRGDDVMWKTPAEPFGHSITSNCPR